MERMKEQTDYAQPGTSDNYIHAMREFNGAVDKLESAKVAEIKHQIKSMWEVIKQDEIKNYGITDRLCIIESLVLELYPDKKEK